MRCRNVVLLCAAAPSNRDRASLPKMAFEARETWTCDLERQTSQQHDQQSDTLQRLIFTTNYYIITPFYIATCVSRTRIIGNTINHGPRSFHRSPRGAPQHIRLD